MNAQDIMNKRNISSLIGANLQGANLRNMLSDSTTISTHPVPEGNLIAWKKINGVIIKLRIPEAARRSCAMSRKHRAEYAEVLEIEGGLSSITGGYNTTKYSVGCIVFPDSWDDCRWNECSHGIHFYLTREEAVAHI